MPAYRADNAFIESAWEIRFPGRFKPELPFAPIPVEG
jgi:hypothetical protein